MSRNAGKRAHQALPKGASRGFRPRFRSRWQDSCEDSTSLPSRNSEALSERDLIRGSLGSYRQTRAERQVADEETIRMQEPASARYRSPT